MYEIKVMAKVPEAIRSDFEDERIILLLDASGSMRKKDFKPSRELSMKKAVAQFLKHRYESGDYGEVAIVTFSDQSKCIVPLTSIEESYERIIRAIHSIEPHSSTNIEAGLIEAMRLFSNSSETQDCIERLILLSDGGDTDSTRQRVIKAAENLKNRGVIVETVGIGVRGDEELDEGLLMEIASFFNGKLLYHWIGDAFELEKKFIELSNKLVVERKA